MTDATFERLKNALADRYTIERELGAGGMATVYLAEDIKHHRRVAVKVLSPELAAALGTERFLQEIETAARLHHPHVLPLYDSGEADGLLYFVMPFVEGESLRERLNREKQLPLEDALEIAREVADALSYTHSHGVVHRDIKPANIMLEAGHALVADFGIATAVSHLEDRHVTETGMTLGTPAYMSPEQASGNREIDGRSDLYSLGCVLYEMLAGQPPFTGPTAESVVRQHITADPPSVTSIRQAVPAHVEEIIARALAKTPADRFSPAAQFAEALKPAAVTGPVVTIARPRRSWVTYAAVSIAVLLVVILLLVFFPRGAGVSLVPEPQQITFRGDLNHATLSPDGGFFAYVIRDADGIDHLMVSEMGGGDPIELHSHSFLCCVQWSPDGSRVLFREGTRTAGRTLLLPRLGGGTPRELNSEIITAWSPDGSSLVSWWPQAEELWFTSVATGDTSGTIDLDMSHVWVNGGNWSPNGDMLAVITSDEGTNVIWVISIETSEPAPLVEDTVQLGSPVWAPNGSAIYYLRGDDQRLLELRKVRVSDDGQRRGEPTRVLSALPVGWRHQSIPSLSISNDGTRMLYVRHTSYSNLWLAEVSVAGVERSAQQRQLTTGTAVRANPRFSPNGREVLYLEGAAGRWNLHVVSIGSGTTRQVTFQDGEVWAPVWAPDGTQIAFGAGVRDSANVWIVGRDGGAPRAFAQTEFVGGNRMAWAPGPNIIYQLTDDQNYRVLDPSTGDEELLITGLLNGWQYNPRPSPDGSQVAIHWNRTDSLPDGIWLVSTSDGSPSLFAAGYHPVNWNARGDALYAMADDPTSSASSEIFLVPLSGRGAELYVSLPFSAFSRHVDITPDGLNVVAQVEESQADAWIVVNFDPEVTGRSR